MLVRLIVGTEMGPRGSEHLVSDSEGVRLICHGLAEYASDAQPQGARAPKGGTSKIKKRNTDSRRLTNDDD